MSFRQPSSRNSSSWTQRPDAEGESARVRKYRLQSVQRRSDSGGRCSEQLPQCRRTLSRSRLVSCPFIDPSFHLLVRDDTAAFDIKFGLSDGGEKSNFVRGIAIIDVVRKPIDRLKNLFFD